MIRELIDTVHLRLTEMLAKGLGLEASLKYSTKWRSRVDGLNVDTPVSGLFQEILLITQKTSHEFAVDQHTRRALRKVILESFLDDKSAGSGAKVKPVEVPAEPPLKETPPPRGVLRETPSPRVSNTPRRRRTRALPSTGNRVMINEDRSPGYTAQHHVFLGLLEELCLKFDAGVKAKGGLKRKILGLLVTLALHPDARRTLQHWATSRDFTRSFDHVPIDQMRLVLDFVYTLFCDQFGPVTADEMFTEAARSVDNIKEASDFSPTELL